MEVRAATPADAEAVNEVHHAAIRDLGVEAYDEAVVEAWGSGAEPRDYPIEADDNRFVVAEHDGEVVGFGQVSEEPGEYLDADVDGEVTAVYVRPDAAREGVGSAILADLEATARSWGLDDLGLFGSVNARPFYQAHGYEVVAERTHEFGGEVEGPAVEMRTELYPVSTS